MIVPIVITLYGTLTTKGVSIICLSYLGSAGYNSIPNLPLWDYGPVTFYTTPSGNQEQKLLAAALCLMCMYR